MREPKGNIDNKGFAFAFSRISHRFKHVRGGRSYRVKFVLLGLLCLGLILGCPNVASSPSPTSSTYAVTYNGNGNASGSVPIDANKYPQGATVTVLGNTGTLTRTGYSFSGWNTRANESGTSYVAGATFTMGSANVTLYALWAPSIGYSLTGLWDSPYTSDSLSSVTTSSRPTKAAPLTLHVRKLSRVSTKVVSDRIIVRYKNGVIKSQSLASRVLSYGKIVQSVAAPHLMFDAIKIDTSGGRTVNDALAYYRGLPEVAYAEPDGIVYAQGTPNDPDFYYQWDLNQLNMPTVWNTVTGTGVVVAVLDTGLYRPLPDSPVHIQLGYNAITQTADTSTTRASLDDNGHGTHVSGTIAEATNNNFEVAGMAYGVTLLPVKVLGQDGSGLISDVAAGIEWAIQQTPKPAVINMSMGASEGGPTFLQAVQDAYSAGVAVIAAAGNESVPTMDYPAAYQPYVLSVGATGYNKELAYYSNYGPQLDVVAPGGDDSVFPSTSPNYDDDWIWQETIGGYNSQTGQTDYTEGVYGYEGTSMATPHVSALAALLISQDASITPAEIYSRIEGTADSLGSPDAYGYGLIDPVAAIEASSTSNVQKQTVTGYVQANAPQSYTFNAAANSSVNFEATITSGSGNLLLKLFDPNGNLLSSTSPASQTPILSYSFTVTGVYRIEVDYAP